jgi:hypothetical protein
VDAIIEAGHERHAVGRCEVREHERDGRCSQCGGDQSRVVSLYVRGVPHGEPDHQIVYTYKHISACTACGRGEYLSHSHDCWDRSHEEPWEMEWRWPIRPEGIELLRTGLAQCPEPESSACGCRAHNMLRHSAQQMSHTMILGGRRGNVAVVGRTGRPRLVPE